MESARVSWVVRIIRGAAVGAVAALLGFVSLLTPAPLLALHNNPTASEDGNLCSDCHNMSSNPGAVDGQTSYLITNSRALWNIKDANSGNTPDAIGCVYCHFNNNSGTTMKGVANHWAATSRHPMGMTFDGSFTTHNDTKNEWLSNYLGTTSLASGELDCVDCHEPTLVDDTGNGDHTTHVARATRVAAGNLYMLIGVSAAGQYDAFCNTCHGNAVATYKGYDIRIKSHKDGSDVGANALAEADGTVIKTMEGGTVDGVPQLQTGQCTVCHDEHYSNNAVLFNDGKKDAAIVPSDCTTVCHYAGDHLDNYNDHGHGKATSTYQVGGIFKDVALACTQCHGNLEVGNPGTRKKHAEKTPSGTMQEQYQKRYNLSSKPQTADLGTPSGNPVWGICITCHSLSTYKAHYSGEGDPIGCQDCHDEHAEGSGLTSNVFMIPEKGRPSGTYKTPTAPRAGTETVFYTVTQKNPATMLPNGANYDFYRGDGNGVCDNTECHGTVTVKGVTPGPLSTLMAGSNHSGLDQSPNIDCEGCHEHNSTAGGWRVSCTDCHGNTAAGNFWPDETAENGTAYPNRIGDHLVHVNAIAVARFGATPTMTQKNATCDTCHAGPGAGGHDTNTVGSLANAADVHGDPQNLTTSFKNIMGGANGVGTDTYDNTVAALGKDCSNVDCHYRITTPTTGTATANGDGWYQPAAVATCTNCHGDGATGAALPNAHVKHVAASPNGKTYACTQCHVTNASTSHQNGTVNLNFTGAFDPGFSRTETYSVASPTVKFGAAGTYGTCANFYCHGNFTNGATLNAPSWYTLTTGQCGTCHGGDGTGNLTVVATGNHTDHLTAAFGPNMGAATCTGALTTGCHTSGALIPASVTTHIDGSVQFDNIAVSPASSTLGATAVTVPTATDTDRCTYCHGSTSVNGSIGTVLAKTPANWASDAYKLPCLTCHVGGTGGAKQFADNTGMAAPDEIGDDVNYGAEVKGHNRPTAAGSYTDMSAVATNAAANKICTDCHDQAAAHINGANDLTFAGQRLLATVNTVATGSTVTGLCYACHGTALGTPALSQVSTHGNTNAGFVAPSKDANAEAFAYKCEACHNAHGMTNGTGYNNIYMIKPTVGVGNSFTTAPGGADVTTIANIRLERVSGTNSMDDGLTTADNVCLTCHNNANRPGSGTALRTVGGDHTGNAGGYTSNDTTKNCASCHVHNYDNVAVATTDGFAPQACNACHSYPGLTTVGAEKVLSGVHNMHVDSGTGYAYPCTACHYLYNHNQSNFVDGGVWNDTNIPVANINVRFDSARNAGTNLTYAGGDADVGTGASATHNGVCANLYCHGDNTTSQTDWVGTGAPSWGTADPAALACSACHATTPATPAANAAHTDHMAVTGYACTDCHGTLANATHVNNLVTMAGTLTYSGGLVVGDGNYGTCSTGSCHNATTNIAWNVAATNCQQCHLAAADTAEWNGQNKIASMMNNTEYTAVGHGPKAGITCMSCHNIAVAHDTTTTLSGTNPFRLVDQVGGGGVDFSCNYNGAGCHTAGTIGPRTGLNIGTSIVSHTSAAMTASGYAPKRTWNFAPDCMNCHDPHGDGTNQSMVSKQLYDKGPFALAAGPPPAYPTEMTTLDFSNDTTGVGASAYALDASPWSGLCQECHERATASGGVVAWHDGASGGTGNIAPHTSTADCSGCHKHDTAFKPSGCDGCHGNGAGNFWPDSNPANAYEDRAGSHASHITAIGAAQPGDAGNNSCDYCHPGNPPNDHSTDAVSGANQAEVTRMSVDGTYVGAATVGDYWQFNTNSKATSGTAVYLKNMDAANDTDGFYNFTAKTCQNVDCHAGGTTPNWLTGAGDAVAPVFSPDNTITVTNPASDGDLQVSWNAATDANTPPVRYDVYQAAGAVGDACATGSVIESNLGATSYLATGLTNGSTYSYCVKAKDGVTPTANSTNTTTANASPTAPGGGCAAGAGQALYTNMANGSFGVDGTQAPATLGATTPYVTNGGRRPMQIGTTGLTANSIRFNTWPATATFYRASRFYLATGGICVGPDVSLANVVKRSTTTTDQYQMRLVDYDLAGASYNGTTIATSPNYAGTVATTAQTFTMTFGQYSVPTGHNLVLEVWASVGATTDEVRIYGGGTTTTTGTYFTTPIYTPTADVTAPVFAGLASAVDATTGGAATLTWAAATDAYPSNPVRYTVYALQSATLPAAATLFVPGNIVQDNILGTTTTVSGLTNGLEYFFGVRATDSANNINASVVIRPAADPGVFPTGGGGGGLACNSCHLMLMTSGAHDKHVSAGVVTECDQCHGDAATNASDYTVNGPAIHNDGTRAEVNMIGAKHISTETNGAYTPPATDTCANVNCHSNVVTPLWATGTTTCSSCHTAGANKPWATTGAHNAHFTAFGIATLTDAAAPAICDYCHTGFGGGGGGRVGHGNGNLYEVAISSLFDDQPAGTPSYSGGATGTCSSVSCHGGQVTPAWNLTLAETTETGCTSCHGVASGNYNDPVSGKHTGHVAALANPCTTCHSTIPVAGHFTNTNLATTAMINPTTYNATNIITYTDNTPAGYTPAPSGVCTSINQTGPCHSNGANWDPAAVGGCNFCHGYPPTSSSIPANNKHIGTAVNHDSNIAGNVTALLGNHDDCSICHGTKDDGSGNHAVTAPYTELANHRDGSIEMNGPTGTGSGYNQANWGCDGAACHSTGPNDAAHNFNDSGKLIRFNDYGAGACVDCHTTGPGPVVVIGTTSHTKINRAGSPVAICESCHPGGTRGKMHFRNQDINVVAIANRVPDPDGAGTAWTAFGHVVETVPSSITGYVLGGDSTSGTSEAEICWNCHDKAGGAAANGSLNDLNDVSEWGTNTKTNKLAGTYNYNFGTLNGMRWVASGTTGATWTSANSAALGFAYKTNLIQSTHTANSAGSTAVSAGTAGGYRRSETPDTVGLIRCSYCHDVHGGTNGDGVTAGKPFLRGTWMGSPYPEDGAPFNVAYTVIGGSKYAAVPRGGTAYTQVGGYYIDQNNTANLSLANRPSSSNGWALASSAGICTACHSSTVDTMDQTTGEGLWIGTNGHANSVIGGTGSASANSANIFDYTHGRPTPVNTTGGKALQTHVPNQGVNSVTNRAYSYRGSSGGAYIPAASLLSAWGSYNWGATVDAATKQNKYHQFPCSKCHNPHASRLPKLLITNCLDINHANANAGTQANAWGVGKSSAQTKFTAATLTDKGAAKYAPYYDSAQNCHRADDGVTRTLNPGWNKVSPWGGAW